MSIEAGPESDAFMLELFGEQAQSLAEAWLPLILNTTKSEVRSSLKEDLKKNLLAKYEPREELSFLVPPGINKVILPNLGATVVARDKHQRNSSGRSFAKRSRL